MNKFRGLVPPLLTPVDPGGSLDEPAVCRLVNHLVDGGVDGIFVLGTTGEIASVPRAMRRQMVGVVAGHLRRRALLYVGIGDSSPADSLEAAADAFGRGADAVVAQLPSYYPLGPDEMYGYYVRLAERLQGPLLVYNIPITTHMSIPIDVVARLASHPRIVGFKDSEDDACRMDEVAARLGGRDDFSLLIGVESLTARGFLLGMDGVVPGSANIDPRSWRAICDAAARGDKAELGRLQDSVDRLGSVVYRGRTLPESLATLKAAAAGLGLCGCSMLPPLASLSSEAAGALLAELAALGLPASGLRRPGARR